MANFTKLNGFVEHLGDGLHKLKINQLAITLSNTAPSAETPNPGILTSDCFLSNVTQIDNIANADSLLMTTISAVQTNGQLALVLAGKSITAQGGDLGPFRYLYLYDTQSSTPNALIAVFDNVQTVTLVQGQVFAISYDDPEDKLIKIS